VELSLNFGPSTFFYGLFTSYPIHETHKDVVDLVDFRNQRIESKPSKQNANSGDQIMRVFFPMRPFTKEASPHIRKFHAIPVGHSLERESKTLPQHAQEAC